MLRARALKLMMDFFSLAGFFSLAALFFDAAWVSSDAGAARGVRSVHGRVSPSSSLLFQLEGMAREDVFGKTTHFSPTGELFF